MKKIVSLITVVLLTSCISQINLEQFEFDKKMPIEITELNRDNSVYVPLSSLYKVKKIEEFKYNNIVLKNDSIEFKNELLVRKNKLMLVVDSYKKNNYLGFELSIINEKTSKDFLDLFNRKFGFPLKKHEYVKEKYEDKTYLWVDKVSNKMIYYSKHNERDHKNYKTGERETLSETRIIMIKLGLTAYIDYNDKRNNPETIKNILNENPNAFSLLEIFKSYFPEK